MRTLHLLLLFSIFLRPVFSATDENTEKLVQDNNAFAFKLYSSVKQQQSNLIFSPYTISSALAMVYAGSNSETEQQMRNVLGFTLNQTDLHTSFAKLNRELMTFTSDISGEMKLKLANSLWLERGFNVLPSFSETIQKQYLGTLQRTNFREPETARSEINRWVKENTNGKINDILQPNATDIATRMVIASAIYFKARWQNLFDPKFTHMAPFFPSPTQTITLPMLEKTASYNFMQEATFSLLELPYIAAKGNTKQFLLWILLPNEKQNLSVIEKELSSEKLLEWQAKLKEESVRVIIPKFTMTASLSLNAILQAMGMRLPFSDNADFSKITNEKNLKINDVAHKAYIAADEYGTEAAAATTVSMQVTSISRTKPKEFKADRPFIFLILDKATNTILFMGRLVNP